MKNNSYNDDWKQAVEEEVQSLTINEMLVVTGSLYFISVVKPYLQRSSQKQGLYRIHKKSKSRYLNYTEEDGRR